MVKICPCSYVSTITWYNAFKKCSSSPESLIYHVLVFSCDKMHTLDSTSTLQKIHFNLLKYALLSAIGSFITVFSDRAKSADMMNLSNLWYKHQRAAPDSISRGTWQRWLWEQPGWLRTKRGIAEKMSLVTSKKHSLTCLLHVLIHSIIIIWGSFEGKSSNKHPELAF